MDFTQPGVRQFNIVHSSREGDVDHTTANSFRRSECTSAGKPVAQVGDEQVGVLALVPTMALVSVL
jgi:hypothetical protein